ncbi:MAG: DUF2071 domain-containing protein [Polyangiales bacterium]
MTKIDRVAPTRRPKGMPVMKQRWEELLFMHWEVDAEMLRALIPSELELDTFEGRAYVGLVPFTMRGVRPVFVPPVPGLSDFHETNVRTYVHYKGRDPGVWFFSLDAAQSIAVRIARAWFKLPYHYATMQMQRDLVSNVVSYKSERHWPDPVPASLRARYEVPGPIEPAKVGTLEHFLAERYVLYSKADDKLFLGRVHHLPYPLQLAKVLEVDETLLRAARIKRPDTMPPLQHYASAVDVDVWALEPVQG